MKPISLQLYSVREAAQSGFPGVLKQVADIGYKAVETAGMMDRTPSEYRALLDDVGLTVSSMHGGLPTPETVSDIVDTAKALGCDMVISGKGSADFKTLDGIRAVADAFQQAAELVKPHGLRMGYHNHYWEFDEVDGRLGYEILMEGMPDATSQLDTYWASNFGKIDVPAITAKYASRLPTLHIKDGPLTRTDGGIDPHTAVGAGKMDVPAVIGAADESVLEWLIVELDHCATDMMQAVRDSYDYLTTQGLAKGNR